MSHTDPSVFVLFPKDSYVQKVPKSCHHRTRLSGRTASSLVLPNGSVLPTEQVPIGGWRDISGIPSLKLTCSHLKMDGWNTHFLLGTGLFSGAMVVSVCNVSSDKIQLQVCCSRTHHDQNRDQCIDQ